MIVVYVLMAVLGSLATVFAFQNLEPPVEIRFLVWSVTGMPLALVILLSLLLGIILASLSGLIRVLKLQYRNRQLEAQIAQLIAARTPTAAVSRPPQGPAPSA